MSKQNRAVLGLSLFSIATLGVVAAFQTGILKRLPGPKGRVVNAEKVHGSREAYAIFGIPDALLGMASYSTTALVAAFDARGLLVAKTAIDTGAAVCLSVYGWRKLRAVSIYSMLSGVSSAASLALLSASM